MQAQGGGQEDHRAVLDGGHGPDRASACWRGSHCHRAGGGQQECAGGRGGDGQGEFPGRDGMGDEDEETETKFVFVLLQQRRREGEDFQPERFPALEKMSKK